MARGASVILRGLVETGQVGVVVCLGGSNAAVLFTHLAPMVPLGVPKILMATSVAEDALVVDIREIQERVDLGTIPGSKHAPRGMLEFWADPASPYYRDWFDKPERRIVLFCAGGGRSALAAVALKEMGFTNVAHLEPGFTGWQQEEQEIENVESTSRWIRRPKP